MLRLTHVKHLLYELEKKKRKTKTNENIKWVRSGGGKYVQG